MTSPIISRYTRIEGPPQRPPYKCVCGAGLKEWYVDLRMRLSKRDGSVFLCCDCVNQIALEQGYTPVEEAQTLQFSYDHINKKHHQLTAEVDRLNGIISTLRSAGIRIDDGVVNHTPVESETVENAGTDSNSVGEGESGTVESNDERGLTDLSSDDSDVSVLQRAVENI